MEEVGVGEEEGWGRVEGMEGERNEGREEGPGLRG